MTSLALDAISSAAQRLDTFMSQIRDIEAFAVSAFGDLLGEHGFSAAQVARDDAMTRIDFVKDDLAVEIELDWRDFMAFVLLVHLTDGRLPGGYYVAAGQKCRKHLCNVIQEQGWKALPGPRFDCGRPKPRNAADLKEILLGFKVQLASCMRELNAVGASVFS